MIRRLGCILLSVLLITSAVAAQDSSTPTPKPQYYTVVPGDTLSSIASHFHTTTQALMRANGIVNADRVFVGALLIIPAESESAPATAAPATATPSETPTPGPTPTPTEIPATATPFPTRIPTTPPPSIGFQAGGEIFGFEHLSTLSDSGMGWARVSLRLKVGDSLDAAQSAIEQVHSAGLKILLSISGDAQQFHADPTAYTQEFVTYLGKVAALSPDAIQVWDGMNADTIRATDYASLLSAAFVAIKQANLKVLVISGAFQKATSLGAQCSSEGCGELPYLTALSQADIGSAADCIGMSYLLGAVSPDVSSGDPRGDEFQYYYPSLVSTYATLFPTKPLCFTSFGYLVNDPPLAQGDEWAENTTPQLRTIWLGQAVTLANRSARVLILIVYNLDAPTSSADSGYAILGADGSCSACDLIHQVLQPS